jgi:cytochrome c oxidase cbb3-type subunit 3
MQVTRGLIGAAMAGVMFLAVHTAAQAPQQGGPAGGQVVNPPDTQGRQGGRGQSPPAGRGRGRATFPAQQRALADQKIIDRGKALYEINCRACHGPDLRGGDQGGPNLLRSQLVLNDQHGELILPVVKNGRQPPGMTPMPALPLPDDDVKAIAEYIHAVAATMRGQGSPPPGTEVELNIVVGDAKAGEAYFASRCASCHSPTGDLKGVATRYGSPLALQNVWVSGGGGRGRGLGAPAPAGPASSPNRREVRVTVTQPSGEKIEGRLDRMDDFIVTLTSADGIQRSFRRRGDVPRVQIRNPMATHIRLLSEYTDTDIHNVTAYLVTLK